MAEDPIENLSEMDLENMDMDEILKSTDLAEGRRKILEMLNDDKVSDDMKETLKTLLGGGNVPVFGGYGGTALALVFAMFIFSIIFFFGYKLYKSIMDKEKKKEEKKRVKQQKKKK